MSFIEQFYSTDEYVRRNPSLHEKDSPWKIEMIMRLIPFFIKINKNTNCIKLLDVGGGAGFVLKGVGERIKQDYRVEVLKYAMDLSPLMLFYQKRNNPDLQATYNVDLCKNKLENSFVDLILMIDVIEHISDSNRALNEVRRIAKFAIFNIPLEKNIMEFAWNIMSGDKFRRSRKAKIGHIHTYTYSSALKEIEKECGDILVYSVTDPMLLPMDFKNRVRNYIVARAFKLSPKLSSLLFGVSSLMVLVKAHSPK